MSRIYLLENRILDYAWGSKNFIPELLGKNPPFDIPQAEMWMGSHKKAPSIAVIDGRKLPLDKLIENNQEEMLGPEITQKYSGELPFLFKVLSSEKPLSIQAHPDKKQAEEGFKRENSENIPVGAPDRNYRDSNHKPELICALTEMWALKGFREPQDILSLFKPLHELSGKTGIDILEGQPDEQGIKLFFNNLMNMEMTAAEKLVKKSLNIIQPYKKQNPAYEWVNRLNSEYPGDIGALSPLFLNLVKLLPGEALYLPARELHAYLSGSGLEIMANSDNVLRGGLTQKHIDPPELMKVLDFRSCRPEIIKIKKNGFPEFYIPSPAEEFALSVIDLPEEDSVYEKNVQGSIEIILCTEGKAVITGSDEKDNMKVQKGVSVLMPASVKGYIIKGKATLYRASVPI